MPRAVSPFVGALLVGWAVLVPLGDRSNSNTQQIDRSALIAALERLMATGEPHHTTHDDGQLLQLAVDEAIALGDQEIERLAIRAASPLTVSINPPVASVHEPLSITFDATTVLSVKRAVPYTARLFASLDGGAFIQVSEVRSGKRAGGRIETLDLANAGEPGFHVIHLMADLTFGTRGTPSWSERRTLPPLSYALYDPEKESSANVRALFDGPAFTQALEFDPELGAAPFATWLSAVLSKRRRPGDPPPDWMSQFCHERTIESSSRQTPTAVCSVAYFSWHSGIGQIWFRTAEIRETGHDVEWAPITPAQFEAVVIPGWGVASQQLSTLPSLLDAPPESRPIGDASVSPSDIVVESSDLQPGAPVDILVAVRNVGLGDLHKVAIDVTWGWDLKARGVSRLFVVDVAAGSSSVLKVRAAFPSAYGYVLAHAMLGSEHAPHEWWSPDPTPENACAIRIVNEHLAPAGFATAMSEAIGCQRVQ
jgi:hypothetical protein